MSEPEDAVVALYDPGEIGRAEHNRGDRLVVGISNVVAWLFPILMVAICSQVVLRASGMNQAWLDDLQWWLYGIAVLTGVAYAVTTNSHVRVDILFDNYKPDKQTRIEIFGLVWLFLPFVILCWDLTLHYAISSVAAGEGSDSPNGLHNLWILKILMNLAFILIAIATWSAYIRLLKRLTKPVRWKRLLYAFPSTMYAVNLCVFYALWWFTRLTTSPDEVKDRAITKQPVFGEVEIGTQEIEYTVIISLVLTILMIGIARLRDRGEA
ncbi:TRAP-type mannitol/chloroaromatic compound transport system permease small subunit [Aliiruegeria haliotis]|uniref:TRAP transporter small permease protein n=1 Tax=Aliiruegeria haliotis TaxID=1280846 RepID=A0A2T0RI90_9RHOB|nr:TRAP transporter small permease subunit [Aliiruegeria haliotis]PRY20926.1 TRAP-type mannitol/chloroaromatic compound transport system permease small subunit [Aliiruegeria haliotis]